MSWLVHLHPSWCQIFVSRNLPRLQSAVSAPGQQARRMGPRTGHNRGTNSDSENGKPTNVDWSQCRAPPSLLRRVNKNFTGHIIPAWSPATEISFVPRLQVWSLVTISSSRADKWSVLRLWLHNSVRMKLKMSKRISNFLGTGKTAWIGWSVAVLHLHKTEFKIQNEFKHVVDPLPR